MDAIVNFKEAAKALQSDERYLALETARKANDADEELQGLIGEFNLARLELGNEMQKDDKSQEKIDELNIKVNQLYNRVMQNGNMMAYNKAKDGIEKFMEYVNAILNTAIDGGDPMLVEQPQAHDCGGECSGCAGC